jgi:hypothetical protein
MAARWCLRWVVPHDDRLDLVAVLQLYQQLRRRAILRSTEAKRRKIDPRTAVLRGRLVPEEEVPTRLRGRAVGWKLAVLSRYRVLK